MSAISMRRLQTEHTKSSTPLSTLRSARDFIAVPTTPEKTTCHTEGAILVAWMTRLDQGLSDLPCEDAIHALRTVHYQLSAYV
jgi:hypothetical protein